LFLLKALKSIITLLYLIFCTLGLILCVCSWPGKPYIMGTKWVHKYGNIQNACPCGDIWFLIFDFFDWHLKNKWCFFVNVKFSCDGFRDKVCEDRISVCTESKSLCLSMESPYKVCVCVCVFVYMKAIFIHFHSTELYMHCNPIMFFVYKGNKCKSPN